MNTDEALAYAAQLSDTDVDDTAREGYMSEALRVLHTRVAELEKVERRLKMVSNQAAPVGGRDALRVVLHFISTGAVMQLCDDPMCDRCGNPDWPAVPRCPKAGRS